MEELADGVRAVLADRIGAVEADASPRRSLARDLARGERSRAFGAAARSRGVRSLVPIREEFALIGRAREAGVPVPEPIAFEPAGGRFGSAGHPDGARGGNIGRARASFASRSSRRPARASPSQLARVSRADPRNRPGGAWRASSRDPSADPALAQIEEWERQLDEIGEPLPASSWGCAGCAPTHLSPLEPRARSRRLPARQLHRRRERSRGGDRLGARPPRRPRRGHRLALHPLLALRQRRSAGRRGRGISTSSSPPTRPPAVRPSTATASATGRRSATSSGR